MKKISMLSYQAVTALMVSFACVPGGLAQDPARVTAIDVTGGDEVQITIESPAGELLVESSEDLEIWTPFAPLGSTGAPVDALAPMESAAKFYQVFSFPDTDDFHLNGALAQELKSIVPYGDLQLVFGLGAGPPASPVTLVRDLPTAGRDERLYAATIGLLSVLAQDLRSAIVPEPSVAEVVAALAADLASGSLNGRNSSGGLVAIGTSGSFLPEYIDADLANAAARLGDELSGLRNVLLQAAGGGVFSPAVPADWNTFYWDTSDWQ